MRTQDVESSARMGDASPRPPTIGAVLAPLLLPFYLPALLTSTATSMTMPLLALYGRELGAGLALAASIPGMIGIGSLALNIPAGLLVGRLGPRRIMIASLATEAGVIFLVSVARFPGQLAVLMLMVGGLHALFHVSRLSVFRLSVPSSHRARALSLLGGDHRLGSFFGPVIGGFIASVFGFRAAFVVHGLLLLCALLGTVRWFPKNGTIDGMRAERRIDGSAASGASAGSGLGTVPLFKRLLREHRRTFLTAGLGIVMLQLIRLARTSLFPLWGDAIGLDVSTVGLVVGIISGTELLFFYPAGHFMDRFGRKSTAIPCIILFSLSLFLLPLTTTFTGFLLVAVLNGFGNGLGSGINMTLSTDFAPRETPGEFIGIWRTIVDAGSVAGPIVVGTIGSIFGLAAAPVVLGSIGVCGAGLLGIARIPHPKRHVYHSRTATESAGSVNSPR